MTQFVVRDARGRIVTVVCEGADTWSVRVGLFPDDIPVLLYREQARALRDYLDLTIGQADRAEVRHPERWRALLSRMWP